MALFQQSVLKKYLAELNAPAIQKAWQQFQAHFHVPEIQQNISNAKEEEYQEGFVRDLFVQVLGFTLKPQPNFNLVLEQKTAADSTKSDGAFLRNGEVIGVLELKDTNTTDLEKVEKQVFGYKHKHPQCVYVITANFRKLRFYINDAIQFLEFDLFTIQYADFALLYCCLHVDALQSDRPLQMKQASLAQEESVTKKLYADYSRFKKQLFNNIVELNPQYNKLELFKKTQKLLDRFLFIFFAEDRGLLPPNLILRILDEYQQAKKLRLAQPLYERFKLYFHDLHEGNDADGIFAYNGGLFAPDALLDNLQIEDDLLFDSCKGLSNYDFESEVDVNILGHIFEHSLSEMEEIERELTAVIEPVASATKSSKRKKDGVFYTPRYITKYIVENTVGTLCQQQKEALQIVDESFTPELRKQNKEALLKKLDTYRDWLLQLTICDPACGSGAFLNQALEFLIAEHQYIDELRARLFGDAMVMRDVQASILENNLYGVDINEEAVEIAKLSLWLRTAQKGRKLNDLSQHIKCGNSLIDDPEVAGDKAFNWQEAFPAVFTKGGFDVVIGNPPYVTGTLVDHAKLWLKINFNSAQYQIDLYVLFMEMSVRLTKNDGLVSFITPNSWLKNLMMSDIRKIILEKTSIVKIAPNLPAVFSDAQVDSSIFVLKKETNEFNSIEIIEESQYDFRIKHVVNQNSFIQNDKFILSVEATEEISRLLQKIKQQAVRVDAIFDVTRGVNPYDIYTGQSKSVIESKAYHSNFKKDETFVPELRGKHVERYSYHWDGLHFISYGDWLAAPRDPKYFKGERILFREILGERFVCTYINEDFVVDRSLYIALHTNPNFNCKYCLGILASSLISFYFRFSNNEFDDLFPKIRVAEFKTLPIYTASSETQNQVAQMVDSLMMLKKHYFMIQSSFVSLFKSKFNEIILTKKLENWNTLGFNQIIKELEKQKIKLSLNEQSEWLQYFEDQKAKVLEIQRQIDTTDKEIDGIVYALYGLTEDEIKLVEGI